MHYKISLGRIQLDMVRSLKERLMGVEEKYQEALDYLYKFIDYSLTRNLRNSEEKFNLDRMHKFMHLLDNPHKNTRLFT